MTGQPRVGNSYASVSEDSRAGGAAVGGQWRLGLDRRLMWRGLLVLVGYYLGAKLGGALTFHPNPLSVMWPPNTILLAALLLNAPRTWPFVLFCAFPVHLMFQIQRGIPLGLTLLWYGNNCVEALIGATSVRLLVGRVTRFDTLQNLGALCFCGGLLGPVLSSFVDSGIVALNHLGTESYWQVWRMRCYSNSFTALILAPVLVSWGTVRFQSLRGISPGRYLEAAVVFLGLLLISQLVFLHEAPGQSTIPTLMYLPLPFLLWVAVRFGLTGTSTAIFSVAVVAIWGAVHASGPFASNSPRENALAIQIFFIVVSVPLLYLSTALAERARAEERFTKAFQSSPDAMLICGMKDGVIIEVNERWEKLLGYTRAESVGRSTDDLKLCTSEANHQAFVGAISTHDHFDGLELSLRTKSGNVLHTMLCADQDEIGGEPCWIFVIRDFTAIKKAEEAELNLEHASRLAVVGELTAMVAHEISQPLFAIRSNASAAVNLLKLQSPPLDEIREILDDIRQDDLRAGEVVHRIRELVVKRQMELHPVDVNSAAGDVLRMVAADARRRHVRIHQELAPDLPAALADRVHLQQVLLTLLMNGMDAMSEIPHEARELTLRTAFNQGQIEVSVGDRGRGIPPEELARIFNMFFTTKKNGMGVGLAIAKSIVEKHQGRIWAESKPGAGATFRFTLPAIAEKSS